MQNENGNTIKKVKICRARCKEAKEKGTEE